MALSEYSAEGATGVVRARRHPTDSVVYSAIRQLWQRVRRLHRREELGGVAPLLARAVARAFAAAEGDMVVDPGGGQVDHHHAGLGIALEVGGVFEAGRADARSQAEWRVVGDRERLVIVLHLDDARDRPENFLPIDAHLGLGVGEERRLQIKAGGCALQPLATESEPSPLLLADSDVALVLIKLALVDDRTDVGAVAKRIIDDQAPEPLRQRRHELVVDARCDDDARRGSAALPGLEIA